jgi:predicted Fe-Mo cluster-binding NifX family protein
MKVAVPTRKNVVDDHFGQCEMYSIFSINRDKKIEKVNLLPSPQGCGCKSNIVSILKEMGVSVLLAGNMGNGARNILEKNGIQVLTGCSGDINQLIYMFLKGDIVDSGENCHVHHSHSEGSNCSH